MAFDPHRDLVPVRDSNRFCRGSNDKFDYQILGKLSRSDLEDRFLRLLDEKTQLKKVVNGQDEKIKRLGTKLLRIISEKKVGKKNLDQNKESEDLHLRVIKLEHENYALKDKNIVLKQQLSSHSGPNPYHRSPVCSNHTSPLMSVRQTPAIESEDAHDSAIKSTSAELKLKESKVCIKELNNEIKSLHYKIEYMRENFVKNNLDDRKSRVAENIEIIRLQRSLKQQEIQIVALQAQVKNSENNQKLLKEELIKAHNENDEASNVISEKQTEILGLYSKLDEKNLNRLEEHELKERINDLMAERDSLKKRGDLLMQTIGNKTEDNEEVKELMKLLDDEKFQREKAEEALKALQIHCQNLQDKIDAHTVCDCRTSCKDAAQASDVPKEDVHINQQDQCVQTDEFTDGDDNMAENEIYCQCASYNYAHPEDENYEGAPPEDGTSSPQFQNMERKYYAENVRLGHELQYLKEMLRCQTSRCETQQAEIIRLMYELKVNEEKCNDTLQKLDEHLKIFQGLAFKKRKENIIPTNKVPESVETLIPTFKVPESVESSIPTIKIHESLQVIEDKKIPKKISEHKMEEHGIIKVAHASSPLEMREPKSQALTKESPFTFHNFGKVHEISPPVTKNEDYIDNERRNTETSKKRFVEQVFLESSDETDDGKQERPSFVKRDTFGSQTAMREQMEANDFLVNDNITKKKYDTFPQKPSESSLLESAVINQAFKDNKSFRRTINQNSEPDQVMISILWLKLNHNASLWKDDKIKLLFIEFSFLDKKGEETETPESLPKPESLREKCNFNFSKTINISEKNKKILQSMFKNSDQDLIVFKLVSEPEESDGESECEDIGVASITVKQFLDHRGSDFFQIQVKNLRNTKETLGRLAVSVDATPGIMDFDH